MISEPYRNQDGDTEILEIIDGNIRTITRKDLWGDNIAEGERNRYLKIIDQVVWELPGRLDARDAPRRPDGTADYIGVATRIEKYLRQHVYIEDEKTYTLLSIWVIMTYYRNEFSYSPLVIIDGVTTAGKSTLQEALAAVSYRGFCTSNYSSAAIVRLIKRSDISVFLDEALDNITGERGADLMNLIKSVVSKRTPYVRAVPKSKDDVEVSYPFSSMAISVKGAEIATDVINRGVRVQMVQKPPRIELKDLNWAEYDGAGTDLTPMSIRTDLYNLKVLHDMDPDGDLTVNWPALTRKSIRYLSTRREDGTWAYAYVFDIKNAPRIGNRLRDIATAFLPVAMAASCEKEVLEEIIETAKIHKESMENSMEGCVFRALVDCIKDQLNEDPVLRYGPDGTTLIDRDIFFAACRKISTRDVAEKYNSNMREDGDLGMYEMVETRKITHTLKSLGISYLMGRGGGRSSMIDPTAKNFVHLFLQHLENYDCENRSYFSRIVEKCDDKTSKK